MPNTNGSQSLTKSMNGLIELEDGGGTVLSDGIVTTNEVITNEIQGQSVNDSITLYTNTTGNIDLRTFRFGNNTITTTLSNLLPVNLFTNQTGGGNIIIGSSASRVLASTFRFYDNLIYVETLNTMVNLFTTQMGTGSVNLGNSAIRVRVGGFIFQINTLNLIAPSNIASLFTTQSGSIVIGNSTIPITIGAFKFTGNSTSTPHSLLYNGPTDTPIFLFTTQTDSGTVKLGNPEVLLEFGGFNSLYFAEIQLTQMTAIDYNSYVSLFQNQEDNIALGNADITINIGSFNLMNKRMTTTTINDLVTLFDTQVGGITMGHTSGQLTLKASTANINATTTTITSPTTAINATTSTTITSPTTTITSPTTTINATTKVDITTPNLNVKANTVIGTNPNSIEVNTAGDEVVRLDFHSNSLFSTDFDSRIASLGGTSSTSGGTLNLASGTINFNNATTVNSNTPKFNLVYGGNSLELAAGGNNVYLDFHSNSAYSTDYDSRIIGYGGTAVNGNGAIAIQTNDLNLIAPNVYIRSNLFRYVPPTTYVPVISNGTCPYRRGSYSITGSMMTVHITFNTIGGGGTTGSGIYGFGIPTGFTIRTVAYNAVPTNGEVQLYDLATGTSGDMSGTSVGNGYIQLRGVNMATTCIVPFTNNLLAAYGSSQTQGNTNWHGSTYYQFGAPNIVMSFSATFPIN
jgi:hypothetical protein